MYNSPYVDDIQQKLASFNAISFLVLNYHLFMFTKYTDASVLPLIANSVIIVFWFCIGTNFLLTVPIQIICALLKLRKHYLTQK